MSLLRQSLAAVVALALLGPAAAQSERVALTADRLFDADSGQLRSNAVVVIEGERIVEVRSDGKVPDGVRRIDLGDATLLPGLIDCHVHIDWQSGDFNEQILRRSAIDQAVIAHVYARRTLDAGFTTVRNVGSSEFVDVALRNAINRGEVAGPRILASGMALGATGSHMDSGMGMSPYLRFDGFSGIADGVDAIRAKVRFNVKYGADVIKYAASAGVLSEEESVGDPQYSQEEMNTVVDESHRWHRKVAAHAHGTEAIKMAVKAGVDSIEHGSMLDDEAIALMKKHGTYLVADVYNDDYILAEFARLKFPQSMIEKERKVGRVQRESFQRAVKAGVKIAFGTDAGVYPHGDNGKQFAKMTEWGQTAAQALQAATINAADLLGRKDQVGSLKPGLYADVIAVPGNPLDDINLMQKVSFVMKGGKVEKAR
ncbi:Xaa-Pro dipeptidase [Tahibacter harae]|uniref:Amidohydrolase family protein n=1 Tax=Tahibacter harae TaxID=2963937 RepID=A0ABT1QNV1_9GAMM|nr:amidohydrolase family protein [Tahibacter harae]MCQ4164015.1 amidohydrolase family protein [Tahibacter harae]